MRRIGLIGGMSWESSAEYYRLLNEGVRDRLGGLHSAEVTLHSVDFARIEAHQAAGRWEQAGDELAAAARKLQAGGAELVLLGTAFTMEQEFYRDRLAGHGLTVLVPEAADRATVHRVIYDELCLGVVRAESRASYLEVVGRLAGAGAQGIVLGCTEIELLLRPADTAVPLFPTTRLHVEAALEIALS
jgi:aspartate racemase